MVFQDVTLNQDVESTIAKSKSSKNNGTTEAMSSACISTLYSNSFTSARWWGDPGNYNQSFSLSGARTIRVSYSNMSTDRVLRTSDVSIYVKTPNNPYFATVRPSSINRSGGKQSFVCTFNVPSNVTGINVSIYTQQYSITGNYTIQSLNCIF
ncbi:hypothetical protein GW750_00455 [bacterium]|nr:hypothetical protein [bacterium]